MQELRDAGKFSYWRFATALQSSLDPRPVRVAKKQEF